MLLPLIALLLPLIKILPESTTNGACAPASTLVLGGSAIDRKMAKRELDADASLRAGRCLTACHRHLGFLSPLPKSCMICAGI